MEFNIEDRMPDEILVTILSRLTLREATQTSIISHRWKKLWTFTTGNLDFEAPSVMFKLNTDHSDNRRKLLEKERNKFAKRVDQVVLDSHKGEVIEGFKVCFSLDNTHKSNLDRWIQFAIQKRATMLELSLRIRYGYIENKKYTFPKEVLGNSNIKLLRALHLCDVEVSGPVVEDILSKCPSLEELSVSWSGTLLRLKVSGVNLKLIEMRFCYNLEYMEVYAPNLMSLVYTGGNPSIRMSHAAHPRLHSMELGGFYCLRKFPIFSELSSFFPQIDTLAFDYSLGKIWEIPPVFPEFKVLKYLKLIVRTNDENSLLSCISLIKACPMLHTLGVEFYWASNHEQRAMEMREEKLKWLKVVEFSWFGGRISDVELVICILKNAPHLEKIIFDPWCPYSECQQNPLGDRSLPYDSDFGRRAARKCARQLANIHSPNAQLIVL